MAEKTWRLWLGDQCHHCGGEAEVLTDCDPDEVCEDDDARCTECGCPGIVGFEGDRADIAWHDEVDCDCDWCKAHPPDCDDRGEWARNLILNSPIQFGLEAQGHIPMVETMISEGKSWGEIGTVIGWDGSTAARHYKMYLDRAKAKDETAHEKGCAPCDDPGCSTCPDVGGCDDEGLPPCEAEDCDDDDACNSDCGGCDDQDCSMHPEYKEDPMPEKRQMNAEEIAALVRNLTGFEIGDEVWCVMPEGKGHAARPGTVRMATIRFYSGDLMDVYLEIGSVSKNVSPEDVFLARHQALRAIQDRADEEAATQKAIDESEKDANA